MNAEFIKQLSNQAKDSIPKDMFGPVDWIDEYNQRFAELIIRECQEVAGCNGHVSGFMLADLIKDHFNNSTT
jgi:hypothetical protein